ncbi:uncharacterized mitochondrial protein-like protein [Tanacetum coccineum]
MDCIKLPELEGTKMSSMGELTFFLGLQVKQKNDDIFISQDKYVAEILKKFGFTDVKTTSTPMETQKPLLKDEDGEEMDVYLYRYLKGQPKLGLWYLKDSPFDLVTYTDSDYAEASLDRKSTTGGCQFLGCRLISWQCKKQTMVANSTTEAEYVAASSCYRQVKTINGEVQLQALVDGKKIIITELIVRTDLQLEDAEGVDCLPNATIFKQLTLMGAKTIAWNEFSSTMASAIIYLATNQKFNFSKYIFKSEAVNEEMDNSLVRAATTASSLEAGQDSGGGPRRQETMGDTIAQTRSENVSKLSNDLLLAIVIALETTKTTQANEIVGLKRRLKKLERRNKSRTHGLKRLYKVGSSRRIESSGDEEDLGEDASKPGRSVGSLTE